MRIREMLNINFDKISIAKEAHNILQKNTIISLKSRINKLSIGHALKLPNQEKIKEEFEFFMENKALGYNMIVHNYNKKNIKALVGALSYSSNKDDPEIFMQKDEFSLALQIISSDNLWNDRFLSYFQRILLRNWNTIPPVNKTLLKEFISEKIDSIDRSSAFLSVRNVIDNSEFFLDKEAKYKVAVSLIEKKIPLSQISSLLKLNISNLTFEFFTDVIHQYIELCPIEFINEDFIFSIVDILKSHNKHEADLIVFAELILNDKFNDFMQIIRVKAFKEIGDPIKTYKWKNSKLSKPNQYKVELARKKLNNILNRDLLNYVFEKIFKDDFRKRYWLKFIDSIDEVNIVGNRFNKYLLEGDEAKRKYINSRYKLMSSKENTCAIIMKSKEYVFVEFSITSNALYIYKSDEFNFNLNGIGNISELKRPKMDLIIRSSQGNHFDFKSSGRFIHTPNWEKSLDSWMNKYYEN